MAPDRGLTGGGPRHYQGPLLDPGRGERAGQTPTRLEVTAEVIGASLQWANASLTKVMRSEQATAVDEQNEAPI